MNENLLKKIADEDFNAYIENDKLHLRSGFPETTFLIVDFHFHHLGWTTQRRLENTAEYIYQDLKDKSDNLNTKKDVLINQIVDILKRNLVKP